MLPLLAANVPLALEYDAAIVCVPTLRLDVLKLGAPPDNGAGPARIVGPSRNVTEPSVGGCPPLSATVAVNLTGWPTIDGFGEAATIVVVITPTTVMVAVAES